jgi:hypothetical protein
MFAPTCDGLLLEFNNQPPSDSIAAELRIHPELLQLAAEPPLSTDRSAQDNTLRRFSRTG